MDFLNKLYESNYFGIGLFAVISFLVVTFLIVLFFGKKDEKKRKLEETNNIKLDNNNQAFKETSEAQPVEVPMPQAPIAPIDIAPIEQTPVAPIEPVPVTPTEVETLKEPLTPPLNPINYENEPLKPVAPIHYEEPQADNSFIDNLTFEEPKVVEPIKTINVPESPVAPIEPIRLEPTKYENTVEPKKVEPVRFNISEEPIKVEPLIKEEEKPIITPIIEEPTINDTYYKPIEKVEVEEIKVPNIDFDAIAKSISKELDELEKSSMNHTENVKVTPMSEITKKPTNQFSSVYVNSSVQNNTKETMDLPKRIDLPTKKSEEIEPESYNI